MNVPHADLPLLSKARTDAHMIAEVLAHLKDEARLTFFD